MEADGAEGGFDTALGISSDPPQADGEGSTPANLEADASESDDSALPTSDSTSPDDLAAPSQGSAAAGDEGDDGLGGGAETSEHSQSGGDLPSHGSEPLQSEGDLPSEGSEPLSASHDGEAALGTALPIGPPSDDLGPEQKAIHMRQALLQHTASLHSVRAVNDWRADQGPKKPRPPSLVLKPSRGAGGRPKLSGGARSPNAYIHVHQGDHSKSAPTTPSGGGSSTVRAKQPAMVVGEMYDDVWGLARRLLEERAEEVRLANAIKDKVDAAQHRRSVILPQPAIYSSTPFSLVTSAERPGVTPVPKGWRATWKATSHEEVYQSSVQIASEMVAIKQRQSERFVMELSSREAERGDKELRAAQEEAKRIVWYKEQTQKEQDLIAEVNSNAENKSRQFEARQTEKHQRSVQIQESHTAMVLAQLGRAAQLQEQQAELVRNRLEQKALQKQQHKEGLHNMHENRQAKSASRRDVILLQHHTRAAQTQERDALVLSRGAEERDRFQSCLHQKKDKLTADIERATESRNKKLRVQQQVLQTHNSEMLVGAKERAAEVSVVRKSGDHKILGKHDQLFENLQKREKEAWERDMYLQKKNQGYLYSAHWAKELLAEAAIKNKLPEIRPDVQRNLDHMKARHGE